MVRVNPNLYAQYKGLIIVRDENAREIATIYVPNFAAPVNMGATLKRLVNGHFYFPPSWTDGNASAVDGAIWTNTQDFAAWLTGYLKFFGSRRQKVSNRTRFFNEASIELLPTGTRPEGVDYIYVLRPQVSRTKSGVHVHMTVLAYRGYLEANIFDANLHAFDPVKVQSRGYEFIELGR